MWAIIFFVLCVILLIVVITQGAYTRLLERTYEDNRHTIQRLQDKFNVEKKKAEQFRDVSIMHKQLWIGAEEINTKLQIRIVNLSKPIFEPHPIISDEVCDNCHY